MNFANARVRIARSRWASVNCSAVAFSELRKAAKFVRTACMTACLACVLVMVRRFCPACCVCVATPCSKSGRLEIAPKLLWGGGGPQKKGPPIVSEAPHAAQGPGAGGVLGGEAPPPPLIFQPGE